LYALASADGPNPPGVAFGETAFALTPGGWTVSVCLIAKHVIRPALVTVLHSRAVL
jgi:hypothetical protein